MEGCWPLAEICSLMAAIVIVSGVISPVHAAQVILYYRAHLNVNSVEWQLRVPYVGCRGLYHWIITVTCWSWQSLSTPRDTSCHLLNFFFRKLSSEILAALTSAFSCVFGRFGLLFRNFMMRVSNRPGDAGRNMFLNSTQCCRCQWAFHWRHLSLEKLGELYYRVIFWTFAVLENTTVMCANANNST